MAYAKQCTTSYRRAVSLCNLFRNPHKGYNKFCKENNVAQNSELLILSAISSGNLRSPLLLFDRLSTAILGIPFARTTFARSGLNFADKN